MKILFVLALLCGVFITTGSANHFCLGYPDSLKRGEQCAGSNARCEWGFYCDDGGICSPALEPGTPCLYDGDCLEGSLCQGPSGEKICVQLAGPGDACGQSSTDFIPQCAFPYECHDVCTGGLQNDKCRYVDSEPNVCYGDLECVNSACLPRVIGQECGGHSDCESTAYCDSETGFCQARKLSGFCDFEERICAPGYSCVVSSIIDTFPQCLPHRSRKAGEYCGFLDSDLVCESLRCTSGYCAAGTSLFELNSDCSEKEVPTCNGLKWFDGPNYQCTPNPCYDLEKNFGDCIQEHCMACSSPRCTEDYQPTGTPGQCYLVYCEKEYKSMRECNGAAHLSGFTLFAVFLGLVSSLLSKKL